MPEYSKIVSSKQWKHDLSIRSIAGSKIAIIGTGNLGTTAAEKFRNLGVANVIGFSRGTTIDQDALINSLNEEKIAGAALDVVKPEPLPPEHPLWTAKNCVITPHCSGDMGLEYSVDKTVDYFCENLKRYAEGKPLINLIDPDAGY